MRADQTSAGSNDGNGAGVGAPERPAGSEPGRTSAVGEGGLEARTEGGDGAEDGKQAGQQRADVPGAGTDHPVAGRFTPLFGAQNEARYLRRYLIRGYQAKHDCRLIIVIDAIHSDSVTYLAELLHGADPEQDLHMIFCSPGGDGEVAVRLARLAQANCRRFIVVVPDMAKSAATILALGAHEIVMGPSSDLGPIDPQINIPGRGFVSAKEVITAVDTALADVERRPNTDALHAGLLGGGNIDATVYQFAQSALGRTKDIALQAVSANPDRTPDEAAELADKVADQLVMDPQMHSAVVGASEAQAVGLPIRELGADSPHWQEIWEIWARYFALGDLSQTAIYEGEVASQVIRFD